MRPWEPEQSSATEHGGTALVPAERARRRCETSDEARGLPCGDHVAVESDPRGTRTPDGGRARLPVSTRFTGGGAHAPENQDYRYTKQKVGKHQAVTMDTCRVLIEVEEGRAEPAMRDPTCSVRSGLAPPCHFIDGDVADQT